jgi:hypothetical protein
MNTLRLKLSWILFHKDRHAYTYICIVYFKKSINKVMDEFNKPYRVIKDSFNIPRRQLDLLRSTSWRTTVILSTNHTVSLTGAVCTDEYDFVFSRIYFLYPYIKELFATGARCHETGKVRVI